MAEASLALEDSLDYETTLARVVRLAVPTIADYAAVGLRADDSSIYWAATAHRDPEGAWLADRLRAYAPHGASGTHPALRALRDGRPRVVRTVDDAHLHAIAHDAEHLALLRALAPTSYVSAPLLARGRVFGVLLLATTPRSARRYTARDVSVAQETARRAALAVDHATLFRAAEHSARAREAVLATVSHDLKDPLGTIMLAAGFLLEQLIPADDAHLVERRQLEAIERAADRMRRLVGDLLDASALDAGRLRLDVAPVAASALLEAAREILAPLAAAQRVTLTVEGPTDDPVVCGDRDRLLQVFANLGGNAIKFTPAGGRVRLAATADDRAAHVSVVDSGPGLPDAVLARIFDRYWQGYTQAEPDWTSGGVGLGLAIARWIVERHGGTVAAANDPGGGLRVAFTVPLRGPSAGDAAEGSQPDAA